jgi:hypothetical protein
MCILSVRVILPTYVLIGNAPIDECVFSLILSFEHPVFLTRGCLHILFCTIFRHGCG